MIVPPRSGSRYLFCSGVRDGVGVLHFTEREPYRFHEHRDNRIHTVVQGDTLWSLAGRYFAPLPRACGYWWAIADFQPDPIVDPTLALDTGRRLFIPSLRVLTDVILGEARRREVAEVAAEGGAGA
ncbi:MAG: LysM domain-containing protein [Pseudomonadota bacterium]